MRARRVGIYLVVSSVVVRARLMGGHRGHYCRCRSPPSSRLVGKSSEKEQEIVDV